jgi:integrase
MALNLYRRHRRACTAGRAHNDCSGEFEERKKNWKRCDCPIFASGTLNGHFKRKSTGVWEWADAKAIAGQWENNDSWTDSTAPVPVQSPAPANTPAASPETGVKISEAISKYLADIKDDSADSTGRMYRYLLNKFASYSEQLGYIWLHQWRTEDIRAFRKSWKVSTATSRKNMSNLKPFLEFCVENRWIPFNPGRFRTKHTRNEADTSERIPFDDQELERMFRACAEQYGQGSYAKRYRWKGLDISDFIAVSAYSGLRISDVATFRASRLKANGEILIRAMKNKKEVCTWIPVWLQERIRLREKQFGDLIFGNHETEDINSITDQWRRRLNRIWKLCGKWSHPPVHGRFRHTFVRILLQQDDVTFRDIAELIGDTEETVRKYYASWVPERQERVTEVVRRAFAGKPIPMPMTSQSSSTQPN